MNKTRILIGLTTFLCTLAATAPAHAEFQATGQSTKGPILSFPLITTFTDTKNGTVLASFSCEKTANTKATGFWDIQTSEEFTKNDAKGNEVQIQPNTKRGPHEQIVVQKWGSCKAVVGAEKFPIKTSECELQVRQTGAGAGVQSALGSVQSPCLLEIEVAAGTFCKIEILQSKTNHGLESINMANTGADGVEIKANLTAKPHGITAKQSATCVGAAGTTTEATFSTGTAGNEAILTAGQKLV